MLVPLKSQSPRPKCFFTHCELPDYVNGHRPPTRKQPFATINSHVSAHTVDLVLPEALYDLVKDRLNGEEGLLRYARVYMTLADLLTGAFFNQYIKIGNILMLSEGRVGIDNCFSLREGTLRLELDKATYERCGLVGQVISGLGRKHIDSRYAIECNLREPSMLHGKKGFDRIVHACKNALDHSLAWLFVDLEHSDIVSGPIAKHHPQIYEVKPDITKLPDIVVPIVTANEAISDPFYEEQLLEWLGMVSLISPRIHSDDNIDRYLCRYDLPEAYKTDDQIASKPQTLVRIRWHGFASAKFVLGVWLVPKAVLGDLWFALNATTFRNTSYSVLSPGGRGVLLWECG